ncbi:hypothetical protein PI124_g960 [Phytophthora idaei]|nr:hypothetical protein PI126_g9093 [Phytophthora idaei]KAG3254444.1 hypothetical protein PI124_g960 [Phytophthora idaei]
MKQQYDMGVVHRRSQLTVNKGADKFEAEGRNSASSAGEVYVTLQAPDDEERLEYAAVAATAVPPRGVTAVVETEEGGRGADAARVWCSQR